jgi:hypothetical protein
MCRTHHKLSISAGLTTGKGFFKNFTLMNKFLSMDMPSPTGDALKASRLAAGLSQVEAATLMGYPVQAGSRGGQLSRTWQALESAGDPRNMPGPVFAMFQLLTQQHPQYLLTRKAD